MRYGEVCNAALQLMNQYSLAGDTIPRSYNNQSDYYGRMAQLVDDAMMVIAEGPRRIRAVKKLDCEHGKEQGPYLRYVLPEDLMEVIPGGLFVYSPEGTRRPLEMHYQTGYDRLDERRILLPRELAKQEVWLEYYRRPRSVLADVNAGLALYETEVAVPSSATSIRVAGHMAHHTPAVKAVTASGKTPLELTLTPAQCLNGETGRDKSLNAILKSDYVVGAANVSLSGAQTVRVTGWARPGDAVYAFLNNTSSVVAFATAPTEPDEDLVLDNAPETHRPIPYYVAAYLLMPEDAFAYASLHNQWQNLLGGLYEQPRPERGIIEDAYAGLSDFEVF